MRSRQPASRAGARARAWSRLLRLLLILALVGGAGAAHGQDAAPARAGTEVVAQAERAGTPGTAPAADTESSAAERPVAPRSMRPYWHVFIAFGLTWVLLLGYVASLARRFARLEETVHHLGRDG